MRRRIAAGNWKMHTDLDGAIALARGVAEGLGPLPDRVGVVVFPPAPFLWPVADALRGTPVAVGAQNTHWEAQGAYTGETSVGMAASAGARWILAGHSERRALFHETDEQVARKLGAILAAGLAPMICVGETLEERKAGRTGEVVGRQVRAALGRIRLDQLDELALAYEPVWAIGTGLTATPAQAAEVHAAIRDLVAGMFDRPAAERLPVLYGGSVKPENAAELMAEPELDGVLVGGASLKVDGFLEIVRAVAGR